MFWDENALNTAVNILNRSHTVIEAAEELSVRYGNVTASGLRSAFKRAGFSQPSFYLKTFDRSLTYDISVIEYPSTSSLEPIYKIMVCPDAHHPYVDQTAWQVFLKALQTVKPDELVIIGDFLDMLSVSAHPKKPKDEKKTKTEVDAGNYALDEIQSVYKGKIVFIFGNHESRLSRYISSRAPELDDLLNLEDSLRLSERGIEYVPYGEIYRVGELAFTHDVGRCGVNAARQSLQDFGDNLVFGHSHRASVVYGGTVEGKTHVCMNVGWLGDYDAIDYRNRHTAKREWQHGFGLVYQDYLGVSYCNLIPIINGSCIVDGKLVRV